MPGAFKFDLLLSLNLLPFPAVLLEREAAPAVDAADAGPAALHGHLLAKGSELRCVEKEMFSCYGCVIHRPGCGREFMQPE